MTAPTIEIERLARKDIRKMVSGIGRVEARYLVDLYYQVQEFRKASTNQVRAAVDQQEPCEMIENVGKDLMRVETNIKNALEEFTDMSDIGVWAKSITGIGPVIAAGLVAHIDITKAPTVGHIWRFAGLDPTVTWGKGEKRPWNAELKTLCWKIGESFVKVSNNPNDVYGKLWAERKGIETTKNELGEFAAQAAVGAARVGKTTEAYKYYVQGKLPPGHIHARAKRWVVKLFLSHWHHVAYNLEYGCDPPKPYVIQHMGHADLIEVPNWPMEEKRAA